MNELKREFLDFNSLAGSKENTFCVNLNENKEHRNKKFEIFCYLVDLGYIVFSEVISKDRKNRYDLVAFDINGNGYIIEIINTETQESIENKKLKYPYPQFDLIFVKTNEEFKI